MAGPDDPPDDPAAPAAPPADDAGADELRARDVAAAKSTADLEQKLDPQTIAQLAAWFGLPSFQQLEEERAAAHAPTDESELDAKRREIDAKVDEVANQELLARIEGWRTGGDDLISTIVPPEPRPVDELLSLDQAFVERIGNVADGRDVERPRWIDDELESTPQAVLRDLYRSETVFERYLVQDSAEPGLLELIEDARSPMRVSYSVRPMPPVHVMTGEALAELTMWRTTPWDLLDLPERELRAERVAKAKEAKLALEAAEAEAAKRERDWSRFSGEPDEEEPHEEPEEEGF